MNVFGLNAVLGQNTKKVNEGDVKMLLEALENVVQHLKVRFPILFQLLVFKVNPSSPL